MTKKVKVCVIGASGYTGADFIRLAVRHPHIELVCLVAHSHAGKPVEDVFPHLGGLSLPDLVTADQVDWSTIDCAISGLPHGTSQDVLKNLPDHMKIIDMSADFRLRDPDVYETWYNRSHDAKPMLKNSVYGLSEIYEAQIKKARLVACPGCYPTASLLALQPLVASGVIETDHIIVDAKSGVSGAGRSLKQGTLFCETGEGLSPYAIASHRHAPEIEQELSVAAGGGSVPVTFTPHLVPMSRGELVTCYVTLKKGQTIAKARAALSKAYKAKPFIKLAEEGILPNTQQVRGSNYCVLNIFADKVAGKAIVIGAIDNLVKGSAGQALQNFNLMHGFDVETGLQQLALFP